MAKVKKVKAKKGKETMDDMVAKNNEYVKKCKALADLVVSRDRLGAIQRELDEIRISLKQHEDQLKGDMDDRNRSDVYATLTILKTQEISLVEEEAGIKRSIGKLEKAAKEG